MVRKYKKNLVEQKCSTQNPRLTTQVKRQKAQQAECPKPAKRLVLSPYISKTYLSGTPEIWIQHSRWQYQFRHRSASESALLEHCCPVAETFVDVGGTIRFSVLCVYRCQ
jgi:hypothetical protein